MNKVHYTYTCVCGRKLTRREYQRLRREKHLQDLVTKTSLIKSGVFTKTEISRLRKAKVLVPLRYRKRLYFNKYEIEKGLKWLAGPRTLFSK